MTTLLQQFETQKRAAREALRLETREQLRTALKAHLPFGIRVFVFGSLTVPFRFTEHSDADLGLDGLGDDRAADHLAICLEEALQRRVDVILMESSRLREKILRTGEEWTLSA